MGTFRKLPNGRIAWLVDNQTLRLITIEAGSIFIHIETSPEFFAEVITDPLEALVMEVPNLPLVYLPGSDIYKYEEPQ